tara:strand:+ start:293 stop:814 length:522 start_codon:yes stop_codon:yes gene_type:complete
MAKIDNIDAENRELMDYIFDKKKEIPDEIYVKLADLIKKKEQKKKINKKKEYQIKYTMTKTITVAEAEFNDNDDGLLVRLSTLCQETKVFKTILRGINKSTHRKHFHDIMAGDVQLFNGAPSRSVYHEGNTLVDTEYVSENDETRGTVTSVLTILEFKEYNSARDVETDDEDL